MTTAATAIATEMIIVVVAMTNGMWTKTEIGVIETEAEAGVENVAMVIAVEISGDTIVTDADA